MTNVLIASLNTVKTGRTKGDYRLWRSLKEEMSGFVPKSANASTIAQERGTFLKDDPGLSSRTSMRALSETVPSVPLCGLGIARLTRTHQ
eukprot:927883-Pelagomonas_calceolata.AAC.1